MEVTFLDRTRSAEDIAHDEGRFERMGLTAENIVPNMATAASEIAGWGAGNEAAVIRFAIAEMLRLKDIIGRNGIQT